MSALVAFGLAFGLIPLARRVGLATGLVDRPGDPSLAIHARPVPLLGGPAVVGAALGGAALVGRGVPGSVLGAAAIALATGLADDVKPLPPLVRLVLLAGAGAVLAAGGVKVSPLGPLAAVGVVCLVLVCANATNLLDGQNGLAGGLTAAAAAGLAGLAPGGSAARGIGFGLAGAVVAFLIWNMPGRIFLGNGGAYAIGTLLAALAAAGSRAGGARGLLAAGACLGVFAFELLFTVVRRVGTKASLTAGDRLHSYDIVADREESRTRSTYRFWAGGAVAAALGIAADRLALAAGAALVAVAAVAAGAWGARLWARRPRPARM